jgi:hypothetical protein
MFQVDVSLHSGNSGGPFIDARGRVVGLATVVAMKWSLSPMPVATPQSDIGMVLPITKTVAFLNQLKAGATKWKGVLDLAFEQHLQRIRDAARKREWEKASILADQALGTSQSPPLIIAAAIMHLCAGDTDGGKRLFDQVLSIDPANKLAQLMSLVTDWLEGCESKNIHRQSLVELDWRSPDEFHGYLARILTGEVNPRDALAGGYTSTEKSWLHLFAALVEARLGRTDATRSLLERSVLSADTYDWSFYLALSQLDRIHSRCMAQSTDPSMRQDCQHQLESLERRLEQAIGVKDELIAKLEPIRGALQRSDTELETRRLLLENLRAADQDNSAALLAQAYYAAMDEDWDAALGYTRQFLALPGRISAGKLSAGLLEPEILHKQGYTVQARESLIAYRGRIGDPWYRNLSGCLLDPELQTHVTAKAGENPMNLLTGHTALGLWAEGEGDTTGAIRHYREALGSYMDHRIEYGFAIERIKRLRQVTH